ncbi:MAG: hypothetical protein FJ264_07075 [Planctomycetes bacterium]|nr:hypothetical protein [Planctomycetota bacterium]
MRIIDSALEYRKAGFSVIPMSAKDKRPMIGWAEFQKRLPDESEIRSWWGKNPTAMVGIVTGTLSGLTVIDTDSKEAVEAIEQNIGDSIEIPVAGTPGGGQHYYFAHNPLFQTKAGVFSHCDIRSDGGCIVCPPSVNSEGKQYIWLNDSLSKDSLPPMPQSLIEMLSQSHSQRATSREHININNINNKHSLEETGHFTGQGVLFNNGRRDDDLFHLANHLVKSGMPESEIFKYLEYIMHSWGEYDEKWINAKIQSALKRQERRERNLWQEIREWVLSSNGHFLSSDVQNCLVLTNRQEKKNLSECLSNLVKEGLIERVDNRNGCFRRIEINYEIINFLGVTDSVVDLKMPFGEEKKIKIMPKNIIVVAGTPNSGKTAYLLNIVALNMHAHDIYYFSSEMGALEMRDRLGKFELPLEYWKFTPIERASDFADVVRPDAINIIDYMEISDEFYKVSGYIKQIFDKLRSGIAIIALQKNKGNDYGLGGMRSLEKPRLYLSMEDNKIKIVKGKNWADSRINPNGMELQYKLIDGCKFIEISGWKKSDS